ncbi:Detected protein of unknown function [Hibiscus syriacus]|uniref:Protein kinase domain-containing protein n=1 Tax=Hibiscus syriacus TaxID=106335 RepID=A0A6A3BSH7_HIBSY|nr:Detected protein of unknown function [Hibiscus syriacus]
MGPPPSYVDLPTTTSFFTARICSPTTGATIVEEPKVTVDKSGSIRGDVTTFESEIPMIYSLEEIEEATYNFDERKKIGSWGYGYVYHGILGSKVSIKHSSLLNSSSYARSPATLLDSKNANRTRCCKKVGNFILAKLVERTNEEYLIATRLVGTPCYLPPELVMDLQMTLKSDVFAFGLVLTKLITCQRALVRDNKEPNKMRSLKTVINNIFEDENPKKALEEVIDGSLRGSYPMEDAYKQHFWFCYSSMPTEAEHSFSLSVVTAL